MIKLDHLALWTHQIETLRAFYETYFGGVSSAKYSNPAKKYESYFVRFGEGARLEIMQRVDIAGRQTPPGSEQVGISHLAFDIGSREEVNTLTEQVHRAGYVIAGQPRQTGDGYYESVVLDPDGNRVEITCVSPLHP